MADCPATLLIKGESFSGPSNDDGKHPGWAHTNKAAQAVWIGVEYREV